MVASVSSFGEDKNRSQNSFDPDTYARYYAKQNGITVVEARYQLRTKYGAPTSFGVKTAESPQKTQNSELQAQALIKNPDKLKQQLLDIVAFLDSDTEETKGAKSLTDREIYM